MDYYVVLGPGRVFIDASAKLQGAELIRADHAVHLADVRWPNVRHSPPWEAERRVVEARTTIVNRELRDLDE